MISFYLIRIVKSKPRGNPMNVRLMVILGHDDGELVLNCSKR